MPKKEIPSISLVFPAWNEEEYVERAIYRAIAVLSRLTDDYEIIVVNDASTDKTEALALALADVFPQVRVISHPVNRKLGWAIRTGFAAATKEMVCYSDIDLPFDLSEIERAMYLLEYLEADLICGYRFDRTSEGPRRIFYSFVYNLLIRSVFGVYVKDMNFACKLFRRKILDDIELKSEGSFIDAELVLKAVGHGFRMAQFGVDFFPRTRGESTLTSPKVIAQMLRDLVVLYPEVRGPKR
jgi:glycosyltransferase involved in cell wall biosynthesis